MCIGFAAKVGQLPTYLPTCHADEHSRYCTTYVERMHWCGFVRRRTVHADWVSRTMYRVRQAWRGTR